jgi:hypothetical protein
MSKFSTEIEKLLQADPDYLAEVLRRIQGPPKRELEGKERDDFLEAIKNIPLAEVSNNQRTITEKYIIDGVRYDVTYGLEDHPVVEQFSEENK